MQLSRRNQRPKLDRQLERFRVEKRAWAEPGIVRNRKLICRNRTREDSQLEISHFGLSPKSFREFCLEPRPESIRIDQKRKTDSHDDEQYQKNDNRSNQYFHRQ